jgi:hypothetical protein
MINEEHYRQIADAAVQQGVSYDHLAEKYERGVPIELVVKCAGRRVIAPDHEWITLNSAAEILGTSCYSFSTCAGKTGNNYFGIGTKSRSMNTAAGCRGVGRLVLKVDIIELKRIRTQMHLSLAMALRVFHAKFQGII